MSFLCGCFRGPSIENTHQETNNITPTQPPSPRRGSNNRNSNRIHIDPKQGPGIAKAWDTDTKLNSPKAKKILFLGLEGSGKTTLIHHLIEKKMILPPPSSTVEQYKIVLNDSPMIIIDVPGSSTMSTRDGLISGLFAIVFVVDWGDELRRCSAIDNLRELCATNEHVRAVPVLVVVNKTDPENEVFPDVGSGPLSVPTPGDVSPSVSVEAAAHTLGLAGMPHSYIDIVCCSPATGVGIQEILLWMSEASSSEKRFKPSKLYLGPPEHTLIW